ncbi:MAG: alanine racemase [Phycisphaerales bacterium]|nr:alanine racemase [Phycisphaerales bacterium]
MPTSRLEVDLAALDRNLRVVRGVVGRGAGRTGAGSGGAAVCAVLKQDGYGVGAVRLAKRLVGTGAGGATGGAGVEMIAVYSLDEARAIVEAVPNVSVLVLMPVTGVERTDPMYRQLGAGRVHLALHNEDQFRQVQEMAAKLGVGVPLHVQIDTGLSRGGTLPEDGRRLVERVLTTPRTRLAGLMTHFASPCCDCEFTREQARLFRDFVEGIKPALRAAATSSTPGGWQGQELMLHAANSCATFRSKSYHGTMVRLGQALLGFALEDAGEEREGFEFGEQAAQLTPVVRWTSTVSAISEIPAGWPVGYGRTWRAPWREDGRRTRIALVPVGYADGYPRTLGGRGTGGPGWVGFTGRAWERRADEGTARGPRPPVVYAPVVGRVSMDQITVDVTDVPEAYLGGAGRIGSTDGGPEVELMSPDRAAPNFWATMAAAGGSITHEQLCRVGPRVERVYRGAAAGAGAERIERKPAAMAVGAASAERGPDEQVGGVAALAG